MSTDAADEAQGGSTVVVKPISHTNLPEDLRGKFNSLFEEAYTFIRVCFENLEDIGDEEEEEKKAELDEEERAAFELYHTPAECRMIERRAAKICARIQAEVSAHPIFAKTVQSDMLRWSLLRVLCEKTSGYTLGHDAIKYLIEANPHALLWRFEEGTAIHAIAKDAGHCTLLPFIAERYSWVFEHKRCKMVPPHLELVQNYANGVCNPSVVRRFYELYPKGLIQQDLLMTSGFPLQWTLKGYEQCDADLFIWMAQQAPAAMAHRDNWGHNVLHTACISMSASEDPVVVEPVNTCTENMARICRFLVTECPQLVRTKGRGGRGLPVHYLARRCNRKLVQEVLLLLLQGYPESIEVKASGYLPMLAGVPFIQAVAPPAKKEYGIQREQEWLLPAAANLLICTRSLDVAKVGEVFEAWATQRTAVVLKSLQKQISETCLSFQGEDVESSDDDLGDDEEDEQPWLSEDDEESDHDNKIELFLDDDSIWDDSSD